MDKDQDAKMIDDKGEHPGITKDDPSEDESWVVRKTIPGPGAWLITKSCRRLHVLGRCHRLPEVHYLNYVEVKRNVKDEHFDSARSVCFRLGYPLYSPESPEIVEEELAEGMPAETAIEDGESSASAA